MAGLQADELSIDFLMNFLTETLYLVPVDAAAMPTPQADKPVAVAPSTPTARAAPAAPVKISAEKPEIPVIPKLPKPETATVAKPLFEVSGENQKGVVVLVTLPDEAYRKLPQLEFLQKILYAIGLQKADVAYVNNISGQVARFEDLQQKLDVKYVISFASRLDTEQPHDKFTLYNPVKIGTVPVVFSQSLAMLENDVEHKKNLWNALRQVFL
ncbi:hypothetical protein [Pontibacter liquoris]|uniref:hypothetical protein n=1 Tax=Pontibacter liquoris TaxID=2905677 RepID=UPI001FA72857|nr:hypothetical protein [Pontibacter liquoris]